MAPTPTIEVTRSHGLWAKAEDWSVTVQALGECEQWALREFAGKSVSVEMVIEKGYELLEEDKGKAGARGQLTVAVWVNGVYFGMVRV